LYFLIMRLSGTAGTGDLKFPPTERTALSRVEKEMYHGVALNIFVPAKINAARL
jgi:hypothetical protein